MAKRITYHEMNDRDNILRLREVLDTLPPFAKEYFRAAEATTSTRTRIAYAYDVRVFFQFLKEQNPLYRSYDLRQFTLDDMDRVTAQDIVEYMQYLKLYHTDGEGAKGRGPLTNGERGLKRKMSALRSFYTFFYRHEMIETNPTQLVDMPKIHEKAIVRLDEGEVAALLDYIAHCGETLTGQAAAYYRKTRERDLALITLLLGTGIRVSECVGLDIEDVDFRENRIKVFRKGGNEAYVYFGPEVEAALRQYLPVRANVVPVPGHEHALFYSTQRKRMNVRSVENLVEKYASQVTSTKRITPHKLRSTYGTALYRATGDIYLVADVLGHKNVDTTRRHYAAMDDDRKRRAATAVHLRSEE